MDARMAWAQGVALVGAVVLAGSAHAAEPVLDPHFGDGGTTVLEDLGPPIDFAVYESGHHQDKVLIAGTYDGPAGQGGNAYVARLHSDGSLDRRFAGDGIAELDFSPVPLGPVPPSREVPIAIDVDAQGRAVVGMRRFHLGHFYPYSHGGEVAVLTPQGRLDSSFSEDGHVTLHQSGGFRRELLWHDLDVVTTGSDRQGSIVISGRRTTPVGMSGVYLRPTLLRLLPDGTIDKDYGADGFASVDYLAGRADETNLELADDGEAFLLVGDDAVAHVSADGDLAEPAVYERPPEVSLHDLAYQPERDRIHGIGEIQTEEGTDAWASGQALDLGGDEVGLDGEVTSSGLAIAGYATAPDGETDFLYASMAVVADPFGPPSIGGPMTGLRIDFAGPAQAATALTRNWIAGDVSLDGRSAPALARLVQSPPRWPRPETTIDSGPVDGGTTGPRPTFTFSSDEPRALFQCAVDEGPWVGCASPNELDHLPPGAHSFSVRAFNTDGQPDSSPAVADFVVGDDVTPPEEPPSEGPPSGPEPGALPGPQRLGFKVLSRSIPKRFSGLLERGSTALVSCEVRCRVSLELRAKGRSARKVGRRSVAVARIKVRAGVPEPIHAVPRRRVVGKLAKLGINPKLSARLTARRGW